MSNWVMPGWPQTTDGGSSSDMYYITLCPYCDGTHHKEQCPRVEEIEYYSCGNIKRVKLRPAYELFGIALPYTLDSLTR